MVLVLRDFEAILKLCYCEGPRVLRQLRCYLVTGGFEHVVNLSTLWVLEIDGFWDAFEDLPPEIAGGSLQEKLAYLRDRLEASADPLM